jgi:hypothetical protein
MKQRATAATGLITLKGEKIPMVVLWRRGIGIFKSLLQS